MKKLFAFWRYDQFPYVLGAEIEYINDDGFVRAKGFGGMMFRPIKIVPIAAGEQINAKLKKLEADERYARGEHDRVWRDCVAFVLPEAIKDTERR